MSIAGGGSIIFARQLDPALNDITFNDSDGNITVDAAVTIGGSGGTIQANNAGGSLTLFGTITANTAGGEIILDGGAMDLHGTAQAINGGTLTVDSNLGIEGSLTETASTLNLGFTISNSAQMSHITSTGGTVNLTGALDFFGATATFTPLTGSWNLLGGTVRNMTLDFTGGSSLIPTSTIGSFSNVILASNLDVPDGGVLFITSGLTLSGAAITVEANGNLDFENSPSQTLGGTGQVILNGGAVNSSDIEVSGLTVGAGVTITGAGTYLVGGSDVLQGIISADGNTSPLIIQGTSASTINNGTVQAVNGGNLQIGVDLGATGLITENNSTINFTGFLTSLPSVLRTGGVLNIGGTLILGGLTQTFDDTTGPWQFHARHGPPDGMLAFSRKWAKAASPARGAAGPFSTMSPSIPISQFPTA